MLAEHILTYRFLFDFVSFGVKIVDIVELGSVYKEDLISYIRDMYYCNTSEKGKIKV